MDGHQINSKDSIFSNRNRWLSGENVGLMTVGSRVRTCLVTRFENFDSLKNLSFPLLKNSVDERGYPLRHFSLKATFHLTISMRGQRATGKIQRNNYHHGSCDLL